MQVSESESHPLTKVTHLGDFQQGTSILATKLLSCLRYSIYMSIADVVLCACVCVCVRKLEPIYSLHKTVRYLPGKLATCCTSIGRQSAGIFACNCGEAVESAGVVMEESFAAVPGAEQRPPRQQQQQQQQQQQRQQRQQQPGAAAPGSSKRSRNRSSTSSRSEALLVIMSDNHVSFIVHCH